MAKLKFPPMSLVLSVVVSTDSGPVVAREVMVPVTAEVVNTADDNIKVDVHVDLDAALRDLLGGIAGG